MKHALIIGGTSGIGKGIAIALAKRGGYSVTIAGRSEERGSEIVQQLNGIQTNFKNSNQNSNNNAGNTIHHSFQKLDCFDLTSVKESVSSIQYTPDILVFTQGMATTQGYTPTVKDGIDQKLQLHYFSRIFIAQLFAPKMSSSSTTQEQKQQQPRHILTVLSAGIHDKYKNYSKDFELKSSYSLKNAADAAGFYNDAGFESMSEQHSNVVFCHASPGFVNTNWGTELPWYWKGMVRCIQPMFGRSLEVCGDKLVNGLLGLSPVGGSNYFLMDMDGKLIKDGIKHNQEEKTFIWSKTLELLKKRF